MGTEDFRKKAVVKDPGLNDAFREAVGQARREESSWFELFLHQGTRKNKDYEQTRIVCVSIEHLVQKLSELVAVGIADGRSWGIAIRPYESEEEEPGTVQQEAPIALPKETGNGNSD